MPCVFCGLNGGDSMWTFYLTIHTIICLANGSPGVVNYIDETKLPIEIEW